MVVHYNPLDPSDAVLEARVQARDFFILFVGLAFATGALAFVTIGLHMLK